VRAAFDFDFVILSFFDFDTLKRRLDCFFLALCFGF